MTADQAADILNLTEGHVLRLRRQGLLTGTKRRFRSVYHVKRGKQVHARKRWITKWDIDGASVRALVRARYAGWERRLLARSTRRGHRAGAHALENRHYHAGAAYMLRTWADEIDPPKGGTDGLD